MKRNALLAAVLLVGAVVSVGIASAQEHPVGGLRIADEAGEEMGLQPSPPGEKHFYLDSGIEGFHIAFEYSGEGSAQVQVRVLGPMGTVMYQEDEACEGPGTFVVEFDNGAPLADNEYVVNAYVGDEKYLADSLQLAIGAAKIAPSKIDSTTVASDSSTQPQAEVLEPLDIGSEAVEQPSSGQVPGGPSRWTLALAALGVLVLIAVVFWAARSAARA